MSGDWGRIEGGIGDSGSQAKNGYGDSDGTASSGSCDLQWVETAYLVGECLHTRQDGEPQVEDLDVFHKALGPRGRYARIKVETQRSVNA